MYYVVIMKETMQVRIDEKDAKKLKKKATEKGHSVSSMIRFLIKKFLE